MSKATFHDILMATANSGQRFAIRDGDAFHLCSICEETFPQTDEGRAALRAHEFEHGTPMTFDWMDLHGKTLEIAVVEVFDDDKHFPTVNVDVWGKDENGVVYHLHTDEYDGPGGHNFHGAYKERGWKWRNAKHLPQISSPDSTPIEAESPLNG